MTEGRPPALSVLIVDDDPTFAELLVERFALLAELAAIPPTQCRHAPNLAAAERAIHEARPHLILLDHHLPDGTGAHWATQHRDHHIVGMSNDDGAHAPFIAAGVHSYGKSEIDDVTLRDSTSFYCSP